MKSAVLKLIALLSYLSALSVLMAMPGLTEGFFGLVLGGVLIYAGIIVAAHLAVGLWQLFTWGLGLRPRLRVRKRDLGGVELESDFT